MQVSLTIWKRSDGSADLSGVVTDALVASLVADALKLSSYKHDETGLFTGGGPSYRRVIDLATRPGMRVEQDLDDVTCSHITGNFAVVMRPRSNGTVKSHGKLEYPLLEGENSKFMERWNPLVMSSEIPLSKEIVSEPIKDFDGAPKLVLLSPERIAAIHMILAFANAVGFEAWPMKSMTDLATMTVPPTIRFKSSAKFDAQQVTKPSSAWWKNGPYKEDFEITLPKVTCVEYELLPLDTLDVIRPNMLEHELSVKIRLGELSTRVSEPTTGPGGFIYDPDEEEVWACV